MTRRNSFKVIAALVAAILFPIRRSPRLKLSKLPKDRPILAYGYDYPARMELARRLRGMGFTVHTGHCDPKSDVKLTPAVMREERSSWLHQYTLLHVTRSGGRFFVNGMEAA